MAKLIQKVLVLGSWAKEQITVENIRKHESVKVYAYMDTFNPGIVSLSHGFKIGSLYQSDGILEYCLKKEIDLVIVTTATPLLAGTADLLEEKGIPVFGPGKLAAQLESDKAFTRNLLKSYGIDAIPEYSVCNNSDEAITYASSLDWKVAVKPTGLTEGLGVKVFGDQLQDSIQVSSYIKEVLANKVSGDSRVIIEEKLEGVEFTLQCLVNGDIIIPTPAVQDFKKLLPGEKGPNTASMGSYANSTYILPFMKQSDYDQALSIIEKTLQAFYRETGTTYRGFLYGQFMITGKGIKLIEYNARPGDPEWLNTVFSLQNSLLEVIVSLLQGEVTQLEFNNQATVCRYVVPVNYPARLNQVLDISFDEKTLRNTGAGIYYSCGMNEELNLDVGAERGIAILAGAGSIIEAQGMVEQAISHIKGEFYCRSDIGSLDLIKLKSRQLQQVQHPEFMIREPSADEFMKIYKFVSGCKPLENYFEHFYKIILRYFGNTCFVVESEGEIVGSLIGFMSQVDPGTYFLWQIGVSPRLQGKAIGYHLLEEAEIILGLMNCRRIEVTIDPKNIPSQRLFKKRGYRNISSREGSTVLVNNNEAVKDYYRPGRHFMLYEKDLYKLY